MKIRFSMVPLALFFSMLSMFAVVNPVFAQERPVIIENIRVGLPQDFSDQVYKVGTWTPVRVELQAGASRFQGELRVIVADDDGTPTVVREAVDIPSRTTESFVTYVRPGASSIEFRVEVYQNGVRRARDVKINDQAAWLDPDQLLIATLGSPSGVDLLTAMPEFRLEGGLQTTQLHVAPLRVPEGIPGKWFGYDAVEAVVLDTNDINAMETLDTFRNLALKEWVRNGGHLVVAIGDRWQTVNDSFLADLLPALPRDQTRTDGKAIEAFTNSDRPITTPESPPIPLTRFELIPQRGPRALDLSANPFLIRGHYGLGRVTVVGLNVDQRPFTDWADRDQFWLRVLDLQSMAQSISRSSTGAGGTFYSYEVNDLATYLHKSLEQFEGVTLVPFGWVAFFVFLYILLIGPGDYFFLKKVVKRMELTWITFPLIVLTVSLLAYATAYAIKGTDLRINRVDIVDIDQQFGDSQGQYLARGTTLATIFSPQNRDYDVAVAPLPLNTDSSQAQAIEVADPREIPPGVETLTSWFGVAESRFGGMGRGGSNRMGLTSKTYAYAPLNEQGIGEPQMLRGVRVPIWTTKSFQGTWFDAAPAVVEADLFESGPDRLEGTITNVLNKPLKNVIVAYGRQVYLFDRDRPLAPGETVRIELVNDQNLSSYLERINRSIPNVMTHEWDSTQLSVARADLARLLMFSRAGRNKGLKPNHVLRSLDLTSQLELGRPILVAEVDGSGSTLILNDAPSDPKSARTTVVRVLLSVQRN